MADNRKILYDVLNESNYKIYNIGQKPNFSRVPYLVLRYAGMNDSINRLGAFDTWEVLAYVPDTSIRYLNDILDNIETLMTSSIQSLKVTGIRGSDFHDTEINMYMNYIQFAVPRTIKGCVS